ncbi:MAG: hypothetical protein DELT_01163 [Desulfovibrio sp.]
MGLVVIRLFYIFEAYVKGAGTTICWSTSPASTATRTAVTACSASPAWGLGR